MPPGAAAERVAGAVPAAEAAGAAPATGGEGHEAEVAEGAVPASPRVWDSDIERGVHSRSSSVIVHCHDISLYVECQADGHGRAELRQRSAGPRTHTLVGVGAAAVMLVSKYGFGDVLANGQVVLDPSRVAAQIVSGIGFIGGGLIFVRQDAVRGLTTAAVVWITAAVGMAAGADLLVSRSP